MKESTETGEVVEVLQGGTAKVLLKRKKWCYHCASRNVCNPPSEEEKEFSVEIDNPLGAQKGDLVEIGLERGALFIASVWAYLVPAVLFVIGLAIGVLALSRVIAFVSKEIVGLFLGIIFLGISFALLRIINNWLGKKNTFRPHITAICSNNSH
jgi:sigma-E factor negative regulatory protein RseC